MSRTGPTRGTTAGAEESAEPKASGILRRKCACGKHTVAGESCDECSAKAGGTLRRRGAVGPHGPAMAPPIVHGVLDTPGQPLDRATRSFMEGRFGHDFSGVRVHADDRAAETRRHEALGAQVVATHEGWTVMRPPAGPDYCITRRVPPPDPT